MNKTILHCDCNNFFASVETKLNPIYKDVPMAVCGRQEDRHGIVLAKNELAKKYGIVTAETVFSAKKKCPDLVICDPHHDEYLKYSREVNKIYAEYTDTVESFGIDESWLDVTASKRIFGSGEEIAEKIRNRIKNEIGITVSIGVSFNKVFAKLGSDYKKPDAITVIDRSNYKDIVFPLRVSALLYVGKKTEAALFSMGIKTIGDLATSTKEMLKSRLGKMGEILYLYANGLDTSPVSASKDDAKSISNGFTFKHDLVKADECRTAVEYLSKELGWKLRRDSLLAGTVNVSIKDEYLKTIQRQKAFPHLTDITSEISEEAYQLILSVWPTGKPIRMITVGVSGLVKSDNAGEQISLFDESVDIKREKMKNIDNAVDKIKQKYGNESILSCAVMDSDIGIYNKNNNEKQR